MFWVWAILMVVVALAFLLWPLLKGNFKTGASQKENNLAVFRQRLEELEQDRDNGVISEDQFTLAKTDLERELLGDLGDEEDAVETNGTPDPQFGRWGAIISVVLIPAIAFGVYSQIGTPDAKVQLETASHTQADEMPDIASAVKELEKRLEQNPDDAEGWVMLAKSYQFLGRINEIASVYEKAINHFGKRADPLLIAGYAEFLSKQNGSWAGKPLDLLEQGVQQHPKDADLLWVLGVAYFDQEQYRKALDAWEKLAPLVPKEERKFAVMLNDAGAAAQLELGLEPAQLIDMPVTATSVTINVALDDALRSQTKPEEVVFVFAYKPSGGAPLAAEKLTVADLPTTVTLDDSKAMIANNSISMHDKIVVEAKIAKSGTAKDSIGDLYGGQPVDLKGKASVTVDVLIDQVHQTDK